MRNKKAITSILFFMVTVYAQMDPATYLGQLSFDYFGTINGSFISSTTTPPDTLTIPTSFAGSIIMSNNDTTHILIPAFQQVTDSTYDVFLIYLRDDSAGVEPQTWTLTLPGGETELTVLAAFMSGIDTSFVVGLLDLVSDTTSGLPTLDSLLIQIIDEIAAYTYFGVSGTITVDVVSTDTLNGVFSGTFLKAGFPFPPTISVSNGIFNFSGFELPPVSTASEHAIPTAIVLLPAYPNPFNARVTLEYYLDQEQPIQLAIMDIAGHQVILLENTYRKAGRHQTSWDAFNSSSGVYFAQLRTTTATVTRKIVLLK